VEDCIVRQVHIAIAIQVTAGTSLLVNGHANQSIAANIQIIRDAIVVGVRTDAAQGRSPTTAIVLPEACTSIIPRYVAAKRIA
jgi:hypothetical protein